MEKRLRHRRLHVCDARFDGDPRQRSLWRRGTLLIILSRSLRLRQSQHYSQAQWTQDPLCHLCPPCHNACHFVVGPCPCHQGSVDTLRITVLWMGASLVQVLVQVQVGCRSELGLELCTTPPLQLRTTMAFPKVCATALLQPPPPCPRYTHAHTRTYAHTPAHKTCSYVA